MGFKDWLASRKQRRDGQQREREQREKERFVQVQYVDLLREPREGAYLYTFDWTLDDRPRIGDRVFIPGIEGMSPGVICAIGMGSYAYEQKPVARLATQEDFNRAQKRAVDDSNAWFRMARKAAGLPTPGRVRDKAPDGYREIQPAAGEATKRDADKYGKAWFKVWKEAERAGRPADELDAFRAIAFRWFAIRDKS